MPFMKCHKERRNFQHSVYEIWKERCSNGWSLKRYLGGKLVSEERMGTAEHKWR